MSISSENLVIGCMIIDESCRADIVEALSPSHFYYNKNQIIFHTIRSLFYSGSKIDMVILCDEMNKRFPDEHVAPTDITGLTEAIPTVHGVDLKSHIKRIKDAYLRRELSKIGHAIKQLSEENVETSIEETLNKAENLVFAVQSERKDTSVFSSADISKILDRELEFRKNNPRRIIGLPTGMDTLDAQTCGLQPATIWIVCGITGAGKSSLMSQWACEIGIRRQIPSLLISTEMAIEPSSMRFVSYLSNIPYTGIQTGVYDDEMDWYKAQDAIKAISSGKLYVTDGGSKDIYKICSIIRRYYLKDHIKVVFVDYLGEIEPDEQSKRGESDYDTFGRWVQQLKHLASYLKIPIVIATQLNREAYDEHVSMKHIAGSFKIIQKADVAIALEPKMIMPKFGEIPDPSSGNYFIKIIKQRNGPYPITFDILFKKETVTFIEKGMYDEKRVR